MAVISFWSDGNKETGQTMSMAAIATYMAIEHNYKILMIDANFDDDTLENCFWKKNNSMQLIAKKLNKGKIDLASGVEGLLSAISSNKTSPEIITNYTKIVFKNRLEVILGQETKRRDEYERSMNLYQDILAFANKYYDLVFIDLPKGLSFEPTVNILNKSHVVIVSVAQNLKSLDNYIKLRNENEIIKRNNVIPVLGNYDRESKYSPKNVQRYIGEKNIGMVQHTSLFMEASNEAGVANLFIKTRLSKPNERNAMFMQEIENTDKIIMEKLKEMQMQMKT